MAITLFPATLLNSQMLNPSVKQFTLRCEQSPTFNYIPGQFITIHFEKDGKVVKRSYSIANSPTQDNCIEFAAGYVEDGPGTEFLFNLKSGDTLQISGPYGRLILQNAPPKRYILVATSTGVTPYRSMIPELIRQLEQHLELSVVILQGVSYQNNILYENDFLELCKRFPQRVQFRAHLSRESSDQLASHHLKGYVQTSFDQLNLNPESDIVYLCGNPGMIDASFEQLKQAGFAVQHIIREKYVSR